MIRFSNIFLCITIALLLLWQLPWCYSFFAAKSVRSPFVLYSTISGEFITTRYSDEKGMAVRESQSGVQYTQEQVDSLLPFFYMRQLMADERFPDTINGVGFTPREAQMAAFSFRSNPMDINVVKIPLYPLLESKSGRVDLVMPDDVFRGTDSGIEFIQSKTNTIDERKSRMFTDMMLKKGFAFPIRYISGNPTARKEYDEGYLLLDSNGKLFHLKQTVGRPYVRHIELPGDVKAKYLFITEFKDRKTLGFITDEDNRLYVLNNGSYDLVKTGVERFNPETDALSIFGNLFDWTVCVKRHDGSYYYALDAKDYSLIRSLSIPGEGGSIFGLHFTSPSDKYVKPRL